MTTNVYYKDISSPLPLDKHDLEMSGPPSMRTSFFHDGVYIAKNLIPNELIDHYCRVREKTPNPNGWEMPNPYLHIDELKDLGLFRPIMDILHELKGVQMILNLQLTGWVSTERDFHQDTYLNPSHVGDQYMAVWIALDDIHPDSGPFQFVRGSNHWAVIQQEKVFQIMAKDGITPEDPLWPTKTEGWVAAACWQEIIRRKAQVENFVPTKGTVLFWDGRLIHRGSKPKIKGMQRKSLICHYSSTYRQDMSDQLYYENKQWNAFGRCFNSRMPLDGPKRT